ncbi:YciI family protein [Sinirhodobacter populi]|uniref:YciI family protein n=1 Tax=Paenirhodobacter populi TaxID=2306993 RepID=A0A443KE31_9RHOB|nr:YciI family protein [Sinirhodobacter populi]RWR31077.1 YciI family protein [Sinirhodobacter populi]
MYFVLNCRDKEGALQTRLDNRDRHLAYARESGVVFVGGPLIEKGGMVGSLVIIEVEDLAAAQAFAANDPYAKAGLFESVTISEWKKVIS